MKPNNTYIISLLILLFSCTEKMMKVKNKESQTNPFIIVLGTIQDGGSPHAGCSKKCCKSLFSKPDNSRKVVSLGLVDPIDKKTWLFEATPDFTQQIKILKQASKFQKNEVPNGIFISHAHIGHYSGLMYLGKEALNSKNTPVFAMPRFKLFLENNGPWNQLVSMKNIKIVPLENDSVLKLSNRLSVKSLTVPHRDEYSETIGFIISSPTKKVLFIPDINKWNVWNKDICKEIEQVDYAFIDATFYSGKEINTRNISEIPHPFIIESMELFKKMPANEKKKIHFIHFNHTNPVLNYNGKETSIVKKKGFNIAYFKQKIEL